MYSRSWRDDSQSIDRRSFLSRGSLAAAGILAGGALDWALAQDARGLPVTAPVSTTAGRLCGVVRYGVNPFWGVPYGASTAGTNRFMRPVKPAPWTGVRDTFQVSHRAPQDAGGPISEVWSLDRREPMGEDCLSINITNTDARLVMNANNQRAGHNGKRSDPFSGFTA